MVSTWISELRSTAKSMCSAFLFLLASTSTAIGEPRTCGPTNVVLEALMRDYGEQKIASFLDHRGALVVLTVNDETRSWTLLAVGTAGQACMIGFGDAYEPDKPNVTSLFRISDDRQ